MQRLWLYLSAALTAAAACLSLYLWLFRPDLPEVLPSHWNLQGQPDGWMHRNVALLLLPALMVGWLGVTVLLPYISPQRYKVDSFAGVYGYCMFLVQGLFAYVHGLMTLGVLQQRIDVGRAIVVGALLLLTLLGSVLGKVHRNFWIGVRTPWTLADDRVWDRTHHLAAWMFPLAGLLGIPAALLLPTTLLPLSLIGIVVAALVPAIYSLVLYKKLEREGQLGDPPNHGSTVASGTP
jgi:uncharacterized membrane protein